MPSSSQSTSNDRCEHCSSAYTLIKRQKTCAICRQLYCTNCAPRTNYRNQSCRICLICQRISNSSITADQLLQLKVKQLRLYLEAKGISHQNCTEKQELVDLIIRNRHLPFLHLSVPTTETSPQTNSRNQPNHSSKATMQSSKSNEKSGPFANFQQTVSSFANQINHFATNLQDYVSNSVSDVISTLGDEGQLSTTSTAASNNSNLGASPNFTRPFNGNNGNFNYSFSSSGSSTHETANRSATANARQQRPSPSTSATSSTTAKNQQIRRKSLSEIRNEENIEDLSIRELKEVLTANFVDYKGCVEKSELIDKVRRLYRDQQNEKMKTQESNDSTVNDHELCKICMDAIADCVFLDCGHMVTCVKCGKLLAECPICRSNIVRVVRVFKS